ncbi:ATP-dependent zinc metalloprotease FtsH [bacterium]|nr:ATP-dependent zinc metalloprotease FtsH [bacterium]
MNLKSKGLHKSLLIWAVLIAVVFVVVNLTQLTSKEKPTEISMTEFRHKAKAGEITEVVIDGIEYKGEMKAEDEGEKDIKFIAIGPSGERMMEFLSSNNVPATYIKPEDDSLLKSILVSWLPMIIMIGLFIFFMRQMQGGGNKAFSFGKSRHQMVGKDGNPITFKDVAGIEEAKEELEEVVDFLKQPKVYTKMGAKIPRGVLLVGAPGTGKTLLAKAVAGEADAPFFSISGSDFVEMFVGVGASRVRDLFKSARENAPCIVFVDEIDAVGRQRGAGVGGGNDEREQTLNQLLVEMDGFAGDSGVIIMAATNRPDVLDPALLRPGRFDRQVTVPMPDIRGREEILKVHAKKIRIADHIDFKAIAQGTPGFSGADLANLLNEAALIAASKRVELVTDVELESAKDKVLMGKPRYSMVLTEDEKRDTAWHEAGHTVTGFFTPLADPVHKVSIVPRGRALGVTQSLPEKDRLSAHRDELLAGIDVLMGGRAAEELFMKRITTGASNDIERATSIAKNMVTKYGMSDKLGPLHFGENSEQVFLGRELGQRMHTSEYIAKQIDEEIHTIVAGSYDRVKALLSEKADLIASLVDALMEHETLDRDQILEVLDPAKYAKKMAEEQKKKKEDDIQDDAPVSPEPASENV